MSDARDELRYPIGRFEPAVHADPDGRERQIDDIAALPRRLRDAVAGLTEAQLDTPYRDGGWTIRQLVHHVADSHTNAITRFKLALTEDTPTIKTYDEARWAELADARETPASVSLDLLDALHVRWVALLRSMTGEDFARELVHPEHGRNLSLGDMTGLYAWHSRHHVAHVTRLRERMGW